MLVEDHKINKLDTKIYVTGIVKSIPEGKEFEIDPYKFKGNVWDVEILGFAINKDLYNRDEGAGWFEFNKGDRLYSPYKLKGIRQYHRNVPVQVFHDHLKECTQGKGCHIGPNLDCNLNYGLPINWLKNTEADWKKFIGIVKQHSNKTKVNL